MIALERARDQLLALGLNQAADLLEGRLEAAAAKEVPYVDFLTDLLDALLIRRERYLKAKTRLAHLPFHKTLAEFDFSFQPSVDERQIHELATLTFVASATDVILLGPPGVGKTHLAVSLGLAAIQQGMGVYFVTAHDLVADLRQAWAENRLDSRMRVYLSPKILVIDEMGYLPLDQTGATLLFQLVSARYLRGSIVLTSNTGFGDWGQILGDTVLATAVLDRLLHHSVAVNIRGESCGLREKKAGLFSGPYTVPAKEVAFR